MKKLILSLAIALMTLTSVYSQDLAKATFGVRGNCGMCKTTIEKAATAIEGVNTAVWDKENKKIEVTFNASKTSVASIETAIAASGYDTENVKGNTEAYASLAGCCQYDHEMKMAKGKSKTCADKKKCCSKKGKKSCSKKID